MNNVIKQGKQFDNIAVQRLLDNSKQIIQSFSITDKKNIKPKLGKILQQIDRNGKKTRELRQELSDITKNDIDNNSKNYLIPNIIENNLRTVGIPFAIKFLQKEANNAEELMNQCKEKGMKF